MSNGTLYTPEMAGSGQFGKCAKCGKLPTPEGHDGCVGTLPDKEVMNACCGHGNDSQAYVQFWSGPGISGQKAIDYIIGVNHFNLTAEDLKKAL